MENLHPRSTTGGQNEIQLIDMFCVFCGMFKKHISCQQLKTCRLHISLSFFLDSLQKLEDMVSVDGDAIWQKPRLLVAASFGQSMLPLVDYSRQPLTWTLKVTP